MSPHAQRAGVPRRRILVTLPILLAAGLTACSSNASPGAGTVSDTLTIAVAGTPTLDPYKANVDPNNIPTVALAYAPLIWMNADRTFTGGLAESFAYTDKQNKIFQMKLRPGVTFADGTPIDADAVVNSLRYMLKVSPNAKTWASTITSIEAADPNTVVVTNKSPNPVMRQLFSQAVLSGSVISPAGLADPAALARQTFGAGPYVLDPAGTVPNDHYTYTANPRFWDKSQQHWKRVVVRVIPDSNATVQAIQTGQVDYAALGADAGPAVTAAGLKYLTASNAVVGMVLADRSGAVAPQLKDVRVRQALNYAIDRASITKAIFGSFGHPTSQITAPGFDGYDESLDDRYPYDPHRAASLLTEAGYPDGFTLKVETQSMFGVDIVTQAVIAQWKKVKVNVQLTTDTQNAQWLGSVMSRVFPVTGFGYGNLPVYLLAQSFMLPAPGPFNPFASRDDQIDQLIAQASAEPDAARQADLFRQATARMTELAWLAPVTRIDGIGVTGAHVVGLRAAADNGLPSVLTIRPAH